MRAINQANHTHTHKHTTSILTLARNIFALFFEKIFLSFHGSNVLGSHRICLYFSFEHACKDLLRRF